MHILNTLIRNIVQGVGNMRVTNNPPNSCAINKINVNYISYPLFEQQLISIHAIFTIQSYN